MGGHAPGIGPDPSHVYHPFGWLGLDKIHINSDQLAVFIAAIIAAVLLWYVVRKTRSGLEMRAVVDRDTLAALRGINQSRSSQIAWILTMILAGLGGILITPLFQLNPDLFTLVVLGSLAAVAISGLRSIPIAFAGGILLGVVQNLVAGYKDSILPGFLDRISGLASSLPFFLTLVLLFFIARDRSRAAGTVADTRPPPDHRAGLPAWRRRLPWVLVTIAILGFALQWINVAALQADTYEQAQIALGLVYAIIFLSFVVVTGLGGMVSLAQSTFVIAGGFAAGWALNRDWGDIPLIAPHGQLNFLLCALIGALCAAAIGALIAVPGQTPRRGRARARRRSRSPSSPASSPSTTTRSPRVRSAGRSRVRRASRRHRSTARCRPSTSTARSGGSGASSTRAATSGSTSPSPASR